MEVVTSHAGLCGCTPVATVTAGTGRIGCKTSPEIFSRIRVFGLVIVFLSSFRLIAAMDGAMSCEQRQLDQKD